MAMFGVFNENGHITACYDSNLFAEIPEGAIVLTDQQHEELFANPVGNRFIDGEVVLYQEPEKTHDEMALLVDAERDRRIDAGFRFNGKAYQTRQTDRENIAGAAQIAFMAIVGGAEAGNLRWADPDNDYVWIAMDNTLTPMDAQTVVEFGKAAAARKTQLIYAARELKNQTPVPADYADDKWWP